MERIETNGLVYYQFNSLAVNHAVFTRHGGVSEAPWASLNLGGNVGDSPEAVAENYRRIYAALDMDGSRSCSVWQVHSADTIVATAPTPERGWITHADGMVTDQPATPLVMRFADCVPVLFHDPVQQAIGIAHAGWRGTLQGAGVSVLHKMIDTFGSRPSDIRAAIGPSISAACYQVGAEVVSAVEWYFGTTDGLIQYDPNDNTPHFDLWAANALDLRRNGVEQVEVMGICTASNTDDFFSHRAESGKTGRFVAVISL